MPPDPVLSLSGWPGRLGSQLLCPAGASGVAQVLPNSPGLYPLDSQCSPGQHFHRRPPARGVAMATPSAVRQTDSPGTLRGGGSRGCSCALLPPRGQACTAPAGPGALRGKCLPLRGYSETAEVTCKVLSAVPRKWEPQVRPPGCSDQTVSVALSPGGGRLCWPSVRAQPTHLDVNLGPVGDPSHPLSM